MKMNPIQKYAGLGLAALMFGAAATSQAQLTTSYTNTFPIGANTASFSGSGSVASWIYWYNTPGGNAPMTCVVGLDAQNQTNTSGCLEMDSPFQGVSGTQNVIFGTFGNQYGYDFSQVANLVNYSNIEFDIHIPMGTPTNTDGNFGSLGVGIINTGYSYKQAGSVTIPGTATNGWVHLSVPVDKTIANAAGIAFDYNNYGGYPTNNVTNYLDNVRLNLSPVKTPPPTISSKFMPAVPGLNEIATQPNQQYNRYQVCSVADTGLGFVGQPSVTYSWNLQSFPTNTGGSFQAHFMLIGGNPGPYDQAADYNFANVIFMTIQQSNNGTAFFNFSYKTNEPAGNGMTYNTTSPTNTLVNTNGWPIMPVAKLLANTAVGNWSVTFANSTNVTITGPGGVSTNFIFDPASAAIFADPVSLILGSQPNATNYIGLGVSYGNFSASGNAAPFSENFLTEPALNTNNWRDLSSDPNGDIFVPQGIAYWLGWTLPDPGFSLQSANVVNAPANAWTDLSLTSIVDNGNRETLIPVANLPGASQGYYRLLERTFSQLQVLWPGQTNAPDTANGYVGTPSDTINGQPIITGNIVNFTVNAVDNTFHIIPGVIDNIHITTTNDGSSTTPIDFPLVNGSASFVVSFGTAGSQTVTATDTSVTNIPSGTSSAYTLPQ
jgi:hypothetical protein